MKKPKILRGLATVAMGAALAMGASTVSHADTITLRIGAGHPVIALGYVQTAKNHFQPEVARRVAERTDHEIQWVEAYGGTVAKLFEMINACDVGLLDICAISQPFEATKMFLHNMGSYIPFNEPDPYLSMLAQQKVFDRMPWFREVFQTEWNQKHLGIGAQSDYGLGTSFAWDRFADLRGRKIAAAGPNLPWLQGTGATPVQTNLNEAYNALQSGVYEGLVIFPGPWVGFKLHEVGKHFKLVGFGSVPWNSLTINQRKFDSLPPEVQDIIVEVGKEYNLHSAYYELGSFLRSQSQLADLAVEVTELAFEEKAKWAEALKELPTTRAKEAEGRGMPGCEAMNLLTDIVKSQGYKYPYEYEIC